MRKKVNVNIANRRHRSDMFQRVGDVFERKFDGFPANVPPVSNSDVALDENTDVGADIRLPLPSETIIPDIPPCPEPGEPCYGGSDNAFTLPLDLTFKMYWHAPVDDRSMSALLALTGDSSTLSSFGVILQNTQSGSAGLTLFSIVDGMGGDRWFGNTLFRDDGYTFMESGISGTWFWVRVNMPTEDRVRFKIWTGGEEFEPGSWTAEQWPAEGQMPFNSYDVWNFVIQFDTNDNSHYFLIDDVVLNSGWKNAPFVLDTFGVDSSAGWPGWDHTGSNVRFSVNGGEGKYQRQATGGTIVEKTFDIDSVAATAERVSVISSAQVLGVVYCEAVDRWYTSTGGTMGRGHTSPGIAHNTGTPFHTAADHFNKIVYSFTEDEIQEVFDSDGVFRFSGWGSWHILSPATVVPVRIVTGFDTPTSNPPASGPGDPGGFTSPPSAWDHGNVIKEFTWIKQFEDINTQYGFAGDQFEINVGQLVQSSDGRYNLRYETDIQDIPLGAGPAGQQPVGYFSHYRHGYVIDPGTGPCETVSGATYTAILGQEIDGTYRLPASARYLLEVILGDSLLVPEEYTFDGDTIINPDGDVPDDILLRVRYVAR